MTFRDELANLIPPQPSTEVDVKRAHESYEAIKEAFRAMAQEGKYQYATHHELILKYRYEVPYPYVKKGPYGPLDSIVDMKTPNFRTYRDTLQALLSKDGVVAEAVVVDSVSKMSYRITDRGALGVIHGEAKLCMDCSIQLPESMVRTETSAPEAPSASAGMSGNTPVTMHAETAAAQRSIQDELNSLLSPQPSTSTAEQWAKESCEAVKAALRAMAKKGETTDVAGVPKLKYFYEIPHPFMEKKFISKMVDDGNGIFFKKKRLLQYWDTTTSVRDPQFKAYIGTVTGLLREERIQAICVIKDTVTQQCKPVTNFEKDTTTGEPKLGLLCETTVTYRK